MRKMDNNELFTKIYTNSRLLLYLKANKYHFFSNIR